MGQGSLFDYAKGLFLRDKGVAQVEANANPDWKAEVGEVIRQLALTGREFTSDDVWEKMQGKSVTPEPKAMGAAFLRASRRGLIRPTDKYWQSKRPECHGRRVAVWIGVTQGT